MTKNEELVKAETLKVIRKAMDLYGVPELEFAKIRFDIRGHRSAGQAYQKRNEYGLRFHPKGCSDHLEDILNNIIPHEIAHLVTYADRSLGRNHNRGWKRICMALGGSSNRCHSLDLGGPNKEERQAARKARRPYVYTDSKGVARRVTKQCHIKIQFQGAEYTWRSNRGKVNRYSDWSIIKVAAPVKVKAASKPQKRFCKTAGRQSKADIVRNLIKLHYVAGPDQLNDDQIIAKIMDVCNFKRGLAKAYFNNNLAKAFQS